MVDIQGIANCLLFWAQVADLRHTGALWAKNTTIQDVKIILWL